MFWCFFFKLPISVSLVFILLPASAAICLEEAAGRISLPVACVLLVFLFQLRSAFVAFASLLVFWATFAQFSLLFNWSMNGQHWARKVFFFSEKGQNLSRKTRNLSQKIPP